MLAAIAPLIAKGVTDLILNEANTLATLCAAILEVIYAYDCRHLPQLSTVSKVARCSFSPPYPGNSTNPRVQHSAQWPNTAASPRNKAARLWENRRKCWPATLVIVMGRMRYSGLNKLIGCTRCHAAGERLPRNRKNEGNFYSVGFS